MYSKMIELYNRCFPQYQTTETMFLEMLEPQNARIFQCNVNNKLVGFSMIHGNSISLLCVDPAHSGIGFGSSLLLFTEKHIETFVGNHVVLGRGSRYLLQGVPVDETNRSVAFFKNRGYTARWESANMRLTLEPFDQNALAIPPKLPELCYRFANPSDEGERSALLQAVGDAQPDWKGIFEGCADPVMLAVLDGKIVGFQILSVNGACFLPTENVGSIGCVGVVPEARRRGIGLRMVAEGAEWLKQKGCSAVELRYVELVDWYQKIGFHTTGKQWMGEKSLEG